MKLPTSAQTALEMLHAAGYEAYLVGGAVRDFVRGVEASDWDITTSALPEEIERVFSSFRLVETGLRHGTVTVLFDRVPVEITTYRVDGPYTDHRRPDAVHFTRSLTEDLARRDFTMNALAYAPKTGVIDPFGGKKDLAQGKIRCVGDPDRRFREDALRILRALRFASALDMEIETETAAALERNLDGLCAVAPERVRGELTKLLCGPAVERVLTGYAPILFTVLPQLSPMYGFDQKNPHHDRDIFSHTAAVTAAIPAESVLRWAALLHDIGKPACFSIAADGVGHFYGHARKSAELAEKILRQLCFDNASRERIVTLIRCHDFPIAAEAKTVRRLMNRLGVETLRQLIELHRADTRGQSPLCAGRIAEYDAVEAMLDRLLAEDACFSLRDLAVNGRDMMAMGLSGVRIGRALSLCLDAVMEESVPNEREALLRFVKENAGAAALAEPKKR